MSRTFVATDTVLDRILARKLTELDERYAAISLDRMRRAAEQTPYGVRDMLAALRRDCVALIAEGETRIAQQGPADGGLRAGDAGRGLCA